VQVIATYPFFDRYVSKGNPCTPGASLAITRDTGISVVLPVHEGSKNLLTGWKLNVCLYRIGRKLIRMLDVHDN